VCSSDLFVRALVRLRRGHPPTDFRFHGVGADVDDSYASRSLAWCAGDLYVMVNAWWQPLEFEVHEPGEWRLALATAPTTHSGDRHIVAPRSIVVLARN
jgi:pullulanase/glycogen debranching enzyme